MKKRVLYLMHVDWGWIKQRPHFIAEKLDTVFDVTVFYQFARSRKVITSNPSKTKKFPIIVLPLKRMRIFHSLNSFIQQMIFSIILKVIRPNIIWITHPSLYDFIPKRNINKFKIIYDCMDDVQGFNYIPVVKKNLDISERQLLHDSNIVFVSSQNLQNKIIERGCSSNKTVLIRNGYNGKIIDAVDKKILPLKDFKIAYIGTISEWVDFDTIKKSLNEINNLEYHFFGPIECEIPENEKIIFHGPINHSKLYDVVQDVDCLIMPFKLNELIQSVDPVKLYEYINFNKNIITIYYKEIQRFNDFVYFYNNSDEYINVLKGLIANNELKYSQDQRLEFLKENTWDKRTNVMIEKLNDL